MNPLAQALKLSSGSIVKNRFAKSAMAESMSHETLPKSEFWNAYRTWANGGVGLCITGNVMVDRNHLGEFKNVVLDEAVEDLSDFKKWAQAGKENNTILFMQLNHPGKQTPNFLTKQPVAPSAIAFPPPMNRFFNRPRALNEVEILDIIKAFGTAAYKAKQSGFDGVQMHAAHGYLISQFLSPKHNQRDDKWGGTLANRMRFLIEIYHEIRKRVGYDFGVAIKINSADFQRGGFSEEDSVKVVKELDQLGFDFIEISGGTYEVNAMMGKKTNSFSKVKTSTERREAYFIAYARKVKEFLKTPLMLTGGFREKSVMEEALNRGDVDLVGMARPFAVYPDLANKLLTSDDFVIDITPKKTGISLVDSIVPFEITWYAQQIHRMGKNQQPIPNYNVWCTAFATIFDYGLNGIKRTRAR